MLSDLRSQACDNIKLKTLQTDREVGMKGTLLMLTVLFFNFINFPVLVQANRLTRLCGEHFVSCSFPLISLSKAWQCFTKSYLKKHRKVFFQKVAPTPFKCVPQDSKT